MVQQTSANLRPAVPRYLGNSFSEAPPGHRFYLYLPIWDGYWSRAKSLADQLKGVTALTEADHERMRALAGRQEQLTDADTLSLPATSIAPFATGLGIEHPLANGFAFLNPYGLPYLPGSSVKGVLRKAARELAPGGAFAEGDGLCLQPEIEALFGADGEGEASGPRRRGALTFRDVHPVPPKGRHLQWDVMTSHHRKYYAGEIREPHDNEAPIPITFLTLPPGTAFHFHVGCRRDLLRAAAPNLLTDDAWRQRVEKLLHHAFDWLGFGAKTAVGYGAMAVDQKIITEQRRQQQQLEDARLEQQRLEAMDPSERRISELLAQRKDPSEFDHKTLLGQLQAGRVAAEEQAMVATRALELLGERREAVQKDKSGKSRKRASERLDSDALALQKFAGE